MEDNGEVCYLAYSYQSFTEESINKFIIDRKIRVKSVTSASPVKAFDISMERPSNMEALQKWMVRTHSLADGTVVHFAEVSRPYAGVVCDNPNHKKLVADGYSLWLLGQLTINQNDSFMLKSIYDRRFSTARAFADAGACIDPKYEATHANELRLWTAVLHGDLDELRRRIDAGDSVDQAPEDGHAKNWTPLSLCANLGRHEMAEVLLDHGANVNGIHGELMKPIVVAASADDVAMMRLLVDHGATVDIEGDGKYDLVHYSVRMASLKALDYLTEEHGLVLTAERINRVCKIKKFSNQVMKHFGFEIESSETTYRRPRNNNRNGRSNAADRQIETVPEAIAAKSLTKLRQLLNSGIDVETVYPDEHGPRTALSFCVVANWSVGITELLDRGAAAFKNKRQNVLKLAILMNKWNAAKTLTMRGHGYYHPGGQTRALLVTVKPGQVDAKQTLTDFFHECLGYTVDSVDLVEGTADEESSTYYCVVSDVLTFDITVDFNIRYQNLAFTIQQMNNQQPTPSPKPQATPKQPQKQQQRNRGRNSAPAETETTAKPSQHNRKPQNKPKNAATRPVAKPAARPSDMNCIIIE